MKGKLREGDVVCGGPLGGKLLRRPSTIHEFSNWRAAPNDPRLIAAEGRAPMSGGNASYTSSAKLEGYLICSLTSAPHSFRTKR